MKFLLPSTLILSPFLYIAAPQANSPIPANQTSLPTNTNQPIFLVPELLPQSYFAVPSFFHVEITNRTNYLIVWNNQTNISGTLINTLQQTTNGSNWTDVFSWVNSYGSLTSWTMNVDTNVSCMFFRFKTTLTQ
jgi:hypothetical protein